MKDHYGIKVSPIFNLCEYNIKINDICWNKVKMTSSKWISCCHQKQGQQCSSSSSSSSSSRGYGSNSQHHTNHSGSPSMFNTFSGRRYKWSPSTSGTSFDLPFAPRNYYKSKDDSMMRELSSSQNCPQSIITLINPFEYLMVNCETNLDTNSAQMSPEQEIIAISNEYWLAFYSIHDNDCLGTVQFPNRCRYWTWINGDTVAIITEDGVYHWSLDRDISKKQDRPKMLFPLDERMKNYQLVGYDVDTLLHGCWCALTALYIDDDGEIGGQIQIYSQSYMQSQCIEAHSCLFVSYQFEGSSSMSNLLVAVKRESNEMWKLYIIELSAISNAAHLRNRPLKSQPLMLHQFVATATSSTEHTTASTNNLSDESFTTMLNHEMAPFNDIPAHLACDEEIGLIFILSKYGSLYVCDLETGTPLYYDSIVQWTEHCAIFSLSYDDKNTCLLAICRNGRVLAIKILMKKILENKTTHRLQTNVYARISEKLHHRKLTRMISTPNGLPSTNNDDDHHHPNFNNYNKNVRTVSILVNNNNQQSSFLNENSSSMMNHQRQSHRYPSYIIGADDDDDDDDQNQDGLEEEITRL